MNLPRSVVTVVVVVIISISTFLDLAKLDKAALKRRELEGPEVKSGLALGTEVNGLVDARLSGSEGQRTIGEDDEHVGGATRAVDVTPDVVVITAAGVVNTTAGGEERERERGGVGSGALKRDVGGENESETAGDKTCLPRQKPRDGQHCRDSHFFFFCVFPFSLVHTIYIQSVTKPNQLI